MSSLLNKKEVKKRALEYAQYRVTPFTRVSSSFLIDLEAKLNNIIKQSVQNHPSVGKTIDQVR